MKPAPFEYVRAESVEQVCALLASEEIEHRVIAGGQTLVPMMAMRLARPAVLVDISRLEALRGISREGARVCVKACTRQVELLHSSLIAERVPLLAAALPWIGHVQTRNRGTIGGSLANADPTAEIALVAVALAAEITLSSGNGARRLPVSDFLLGAMETALQPGELLTEVHFPASDGASVGAAVEEVSARDGDFAILSAAAQVALAPDGTCHAIHLASGGASPVPRKPTAVEAALLGTKLSDDEVGAACRRIDEVLDPSDDVQASAAYRRRVAPGLLARAIRSARDRVIEGAGA